MKLMRIITANGIYLVDKVECKILKYPDIPEKEFKYVIGYLNGEKAIKLGPLEEDDDTWDVIQETLIKTNEYSW